MARTYYCYALKLNPNNNRALYGILLVTSNLKKTEKSKDEVSKMSSWASNKLIEQYKQKSEDSSVEDVEKMFKYLQV